MKKIYRIPFFAPGLFILALLGYGAILLYELGPAGVLIPLGAHQRDLIAPAALAPFMALVAYLWAGSRGEVILSDDRITLRRFGREQSLPYVEIIAVRERDWRLPPSMVLVGRRNKLRISRRVENFSALYQTLRLRVPTVINRDLALTGAASGTWRLCWTRAFIAAIVTILVLYTAAMAGLFLETVRLLQVTWAPLVATALVMFVTLIIGLVFVSVIIQPGQPYEYIFRPGEIRFRCPLGDWIGIGTEQFNRLDLRQEAAGGENRSSVILVHSGGLELIIDQRRARQFGHEPEQIYKTLKGMYR